MFCFLSSSYSLCSVRSRSFNFSPCASAVRSASNDANTKRKLQNPKKKRETHANRFWTAPLPPALFPRGDRHRRDYANHEKMTRTVSNHHDRTHTKHTTVRPICEFSLCSEQFAFFLVERFSRRRQLRLQLGRLRRVLFVCAFAYDHKRELSAQHCTLRNLCYVAFRFPWHAHQQQRRVYAPAAAAGHACARVSCVSKWNVAERENTKQQRLLSSHLRNLTAKVRELV